MNEINVHRPIARLPFHVRNMIPAVLNGFLIGVGATRLWKAWRNEGVPE